MKLFDFRLLLNLVKILFIYKYRRSFFLIIFSIINVLSLIIFISLVFSSLFEEKFFEKLLFIFSAYIPWNFFSNSVIYSSGVITNNSSLIKNIYFSKYYLPLASCILFLIEFFILLSLYFFLLISLNIKLDINIYHLIFLISIFFIFTFSVSLIASVITVFFRDFPSILSSLIQITFFLTPVIYDKSILLIDSLNVEMLNPLISFVSSFRNLIYLQNNIIEYKLCLIFSLCFFMISTFIFNKLENKFSLYL